MTFQILDIIKGTIVDGPGFRTSIYMAGCSHHCPGCHNPESWDPEAGKEMSLQEIMDIVEEEDFDVTLSGGDPLYYPEKLEVLIKALKINRRNVWVYTGFSWEQIISSPKLRSSIQNADVLVDGKFIKELRNIDLPFRGSSNQRIIKIGESLKEGSIILYS